jgi:hypothetical protein
VPSWKGIAWNLECICDDDDWYREMAPVLLALVPEAFFWRDLAHVSSASGKFAKLTAASFKKAVTATARSWDLASTTDDFPPLTFGSHRLGNQVSFTLTLRDDTWRKAGPQLAHSLEELSLQWVRALRGQAIFRGDSGVYPAFYPELEYPHVEDLRENPIFRYDLAMNVIDRRLVARLIAVDQAEVAGMMKRMCAAPLPRGVRRIDDGEQTLLLWTDDLHDEKALAKAAAAHERWLDKAIRGKS